MEQIYLDQAATSFPKPEGVAREMVRYIGAVGASVGRGSYASAREAELIVLETRELLCELFDFDDPRRVIFTSGNTMGLNMVLKGFLRPGDHCIVSSMEHNAVMRPLTQLSESGVTFSRIPCGRDGIFNPQDILPLIRPETRLLCITHASNVSGGIQNIEAVGEICRERNIAFALDAAQTAGDLPVNFRRANLSALSAPGHKGLLGPSGIGALLLSREFAENLTPLLSGGTGSASHLETVPEWYPDRLEPGTPNLPGIYGLHAALKWLGTVGVENIRNHSLSLTRRFMEGLSDIPGIYVPGPTDAAHRVGVVSVDFTGLDNALCADTLEQKYGILTRCGLHCAPAAHRTLGTFPGGTVRFSFGYFNTEREIDAAIEACGKISANGVRL